MQMSYISRVICLALCSAGALQAVLEWTAWAVSPAVLRQKQEDTARQTERALFLLALAARLGPWLLVFGFLVPAYLRGEDNRSAERVGFACAGAALCVLGWALVRLVHSLCAVYSAYRCCRRCRVLGSGPLHPALLLYPGERSLMAVAGLFSPKVIVSQPLLDTTRFPASGLEIAFAHEAAHVRNRDNLKLFLLSLFPYIPLATKGRPSLQQRWRLAAELAADEEGVQGDAKRSLALAEMLVTMAREANEVVPQGLVALFSTSEHLRVRVERLLARLEPSSDELPRNAGRRKLWLLLPFAASTGMLIALGYVCLFFGHRAAEFLLHLG